MAVGDLLELADRMSVIMNEERLGGRKAVALPLISGSNPNLNVGPLIVFDDLVSDASSTSDLLVVLESRICRNGGGEGNARWFLTLSLLLVFDCC